MNELYHHGIKGMKWGVRRYQNPDGTLTEAGKKRYNYGSVTVQHIKGKNGDPDTVRFWNKEKEIELSKKSFQETVESGEHYVMKLASVSTGLKMRDIEKSLKYDPESVTQFNELLDRYTEKQLTSILNEYGQNKRSTTKTVSRQKTPKYTQEQAIDKAYSDLEKKYPNFNKMSQDKQDALFWDYLNESGLYKYV